MLQISPFLRMRGFTPQSVWPALIFVGLVVWTFCYFFDPSILHPGNIGWISEGDLRQHYLGWVALRQAETLGNPLGTSPLLAYPFGAPISSTDSNPLVSLILWPFSDFLPEDFQFIGPWYLLSLTLSLAFATALMRHAGFDRITGVLLAAVLAFQPILFWRYGHDTLTAQWLILAAVYVSVVVDRPVRAAIYHGILLLLAISIHPYLFIMLNFIVGFDLLARMTRANGIRFGVIERVGLLFAAVVAGSLFAGAKLGVFSLQTASQNEIGVHSADPLGFFNPFDASRILPQLPAGDGQYEGFAYLGLGGLVFFALLLVMTIRGNIRLANWQRLLPLFAGALVAFLFALSPIVTTLGQPVFTLELGDDSIVREVFSKLRSSGRFVWITIYVMVLTGILCLPRDRAWRMRGLAGLVIALQFWDLAPLAERSRADTAYREVEAHILDSTEWQERIARADYIYLSRNLGLEFSLDAGAAAFPLNTPLTWFYTAQGLGMPRQIAAEEQLRLRVLNGGHDPLGLYLLDSEVELPLVHRNAKSVLTTRAFEGFHVMETQAFVPDVELQSATHGLTEMLQWCETDCTALIVAKEDASAFLSAQAKVHMAARGSRIGNLGINDSYAVILRDGKIVEEQMAAGEDVSINATVGTRSISLLSSVEDVNVASAVSLDGVDYSRNSRGLNLLLVKDDGRLVSAAFDTHTTSDSLYPDERFKGAASDLIADAGSPGQDAGRLLPEGYQNGRPAMTYEEFTAIEGPKSAEPFIAIGRLLTRESSLLDVLSGCRQGCTMAISVKDEGSNSLPLAVRAMAAQLGLRLANLSFRDGYSAIVENGIVLVQGLSFEEVVDVAEVVEGKQIRVRSAGYQAGNLSSVTIDGDELSLNQRGINIVVMLDGERTISYHFDTHGGV